MQRRTPTDELPRRMELGRVVGGRYRVTRALASGGMGSLWVARHEALDVDVALKVLTPDLAAQPSARARFEREAKMLATVRSAHLVHVHDYGVDDVSNESASRLVDEGLPFLVMELLHGEDLGARLERVRRLPPREVQALLAQVAKGLRRAHEAGLVHRDLKPSNVFLALVDGEECAKIVDFGAAKDRIARVSGEGTKTGEILGSPHFMSPEQLRGERDLDHRSDLWSLSVVLYRALTGVLPFPSTDLGSLIAEVLTEPLAPPSMIAIDLPDAIDAFFFRALARDADARFQSVRDLERAFEEALAEPARSASAPAVVSTALAFEATKPASPLAREASTVNAPRIEPAATPSPPTPPRSRSVAAAVIGLAVGLAMGFAIAATRSPAPITPVVTARASSEAPQAPSAIAASARAPAAASASPTSSATPSPSASASADTRAREPARSQGGAERWGF